MSTQPASSKPLEDDVQKLKAAFDANFASAAAADHDRLLAEAIRYLDKVNQVATNNPKLNVDVGDAYQKLGTLEESDAKSGNSNRAALTTYQKAAATLASASGTEGAKQHLAVVNARIRALGGAVPPLPTEPVAQEAVVTPAPAPEVPAETETAKTALPGLKTNHPHVATAPPPVQPTVVPEKPPISPETEDQLISVTSKVQIADQTMEPVRRNLERDGQSLNADTMERMARMHAALERAKRAVSNRNEADAKESLAAADGLATKVLASVGR